MPGEALHNIRYEQETLGFFDISEEPIYGTGKPIIPRIPSKVRSEYDLKKKYLSQLLPLEEYDLIIVLFSGGKDSMAAYYRLIELGVPKEKIELWHHDIDGGHPQLRMDWAVTLPYVRAFAEAEGVQLRVSYRVNGFWGEVYRVGASYPIQYEDRGEIKTCQLTKNQLESDRLRERILAGYNPKDAAKIREFGYRMKFPAKSADLSKRWCSASLKIDVANSVIRNLEDWEALTEIGQRLKLPAKSGCHQGRWCSGNLKAAVQSGVTSNLEKTNKNVKLLIVSGERREESRGRSMYNEIERHQTHAIAKKGRLVHQWRCVIDYPEYSVWQCLKRHRVNAHPCYYCGWNRCSCLMCIFSLPKHWAGIRELFPEMYDMMRQAEIDLSFTLDNKKTLDEYVGDSLSCVCRENPKALSQLLSGVYQPEDIYSKGIWKYPAGAFHGAEGGPC